jgi:hypothetical protein
MPVVTSWLMKKFEAIGNVQQFVFRFREEKRKTGHHA